MSRAGPLDAEPLIGRASAARVVRAALPALAGFRTRDDLLVAPDADEARIWVRWPADEFAITLALFSTSGAELFREEGGDWHRVGEWLPARRPPPPLSAFVPIHRALSPARATWEVPDPTVRAIELRLVPDQRPRPTSALRARCVELIAWAESLPAPRLRSIEAARDGEWVLLIGAGLPCSDGERWWGGRVLIPLGLRPEPNLTDEFLASALGLQAGERALLRAGEGGASAEVLPAGTFARLSLGGLRRATAGGAA